MTPMTAAIAISVVRPEASIIQRTRATKPAAGSGDGSSAIGALMDNQQQSEKVVIAAAEAGERLDRVLAARIAGLSRSRLKALILAGEVTIGAGTVSDPGHRVNAGDAVVVRLPEPEAAAPQGEA